MEIQDEESVFVKAIEIEHPHDRDQYLDQACADNTEMRASVEQLLAMHDTAGTFLETPAIGMPISAPEEKVGDLIDRFRLEKRIGEGAFGVVWRARQERPVERKVALKILRRDNGTNRIISRFESERQTLAMMNHPNIATVLDAGTTDSGRPYFAMELVDGESIDTYCQSKKLNVRQRVEMLQRICKAVHHAHQKGIVHRDLKPSNVLVATVDGAPSVKIIDFGIAKALREDSSELQTTVNQALKTNHEIDTTLMHTDDHAVMGTPHYMSPEQFEGQFGIDTRADVYALGGIAYHLMAGCAPYQSDGKQTLVEIRDRVCGDAPAMAPSRRLAENSRSKKHNDDTTASRIGGDLDAIILKALQKDPNRRYQSADEFANDLYRFLASQPVSARRASPTYVIRKFVARHRIPAFAALVAVSALVIGTVTATVGWIQADAAKVDANNEYIRAEGERKKADQSRLRAEKEAGNARQVAQLLQEMLGASDPDRGLPANYTISQQLDVFAEKLRDETHLSSAEVRAELLRTVGRSYLSLRSIPKAEVHLREALELRREIFAEDHPAVLESRVDLVQFFLFSHRSRELQEELEDLIPTLEESDRGDLLVQAVVFAGSTQATGNRVNSVQAARHAWEVARDFYGDDHWVTLTQRSRSAAQEAALTNDNLVLARFERESQNALDLLRKNWPAHRYEHAVVESHLARIQVFRGKLQDAEVRLRTLVDSFQQLQGEQSLLAARQSFELARVLYLQGRLTEAKGLVVAAIEDAEKFSGEHARHIERFFGTLSKILRSADPDEAPQLLRRSIAAIRTNDGGDPFAMVRRLRTQATRLIQSKQYDEAELMLVEIIDIHRTLRNPKALRRVMIDLDELRRTRDAAR